MMKVIVMSLSVLLALLGCAAADSDSETEIQMLSFNCAGGEQLQVAFNTEKHHAELRRNGDSFVLTQQRVASGFRYSDGRRTIRGKGAELIVEIGRMAPMSCRQR